MDVNKVTTQPATTETHKFRMNGMTNRCSVCDLESWDMVHRLPWPRTQPQAPGVPQTQQEWIDFYREHTANLQAELATLRTRENEAGKERELLREALKDASEEKLSAEAFLCVVGNLLNPTKPTPEDIAWAKAAIAELPTPQPSQPMEIPEDLRALYNACSGAKFMHERVIRELIERIARLEGKGAAK